MCIIVFARTAEAQRNVYTSPIVHPSCPQAQTARHTSTSLHTQLATWHSLSGTRTILQQPRIQPAPATTLYILIRRQGFWKKLHIAPRPGAHLTNLVNYPAGLYLAKMLNPISSPDPPHSIHTTRDSSQAFCAMQQRLNSLTH